MSNEKNSIHSALELAGISTENIDIAALGYAMSLSGISVWQLINAIQGVMDTLHSVTELVKKYHLVVCEPRRRQTKYMVKNAHLARYKGPCKKINPTARSRLIG